ncbi:glycosyltransferase family 2 protein [Fodinisporobacter ferrooxydans]|uniref:Glycosyltransferase family 2 protein n=1 Tax=Fodinisporobacter ferrooxydans TaxID=2901836 RepID=A0ABY4CEU8_9BACL|nr:glycosyltransferase family 2 protein [Alicyclobacillaceae bacterium MYW30-H2]
MKPFLLLIPAYNEELNIGNVLEDILATKLPVDIVVVNDGSTDHTEETAGMFPVTVLTHPCNLGYGAALQTGYLYAVKNKYSYVIQFDADGQHNPGDVSILMEELDKGTVDIVMGSRYMEGATSFPSSPFKKAAVYFFRQLIYSLTKKEILDPTSGLRGMSRPVVQYLASFEHFPSDFPDADLLIQILLKNFKIKEVPVHMRERAAGTSMHKGLRPIFYMVKVLLSLLVFLIRYKVSKRVSIYE